MSKSKDLLGLDLYTEMANEETNIFNRRDSWNPEDCVDEKFNEYMRPHSLAYFSRLRPLFSFEVKDLTSLSSFSHVLFRDGILFLLRFFQIHPHPENLRTKILIHKDLAFLVPKDWEQNILLFETVMKETLKGSKKLKEDLLLTVTFGEREFEEEGIKKLCEEINTLKSVEKITVMPFYNILRGEDFLSYDRANLFSQMEIFKSYLNNQKLDFIDYSQRGRLTYRDLLFHNYNAGKVYYADSLLDHEFAGGEATPLRAKESKEIISLSPYHGMEISPFRLSTEQKKKREYLSKYPRDFKSEPIVSRDKEDFFDIFYYSKNILKLAYELGKGIL